jgi:hypothetical protein
LGRVAVLDQALQIGAVGYVYNQLSCDGGSGDRVGCFQSRVVGIGPQIGYIVPLSREYQGYFNFKGYKEFDPQHRADGWNLWLTFAVSPAAPTPTPPPKRMLTK